MTLLLQAPSAVAVYVGGTPVAYSKAQPLRRGKRLLVPVRETVEAMGGTVSGPLGHRLYMTLGRHRVTLSLNGGKSRVDGIPRTLKARPWISKGEVVVPPAFFSDAMHLPVAIDRKHGTVRIYAGGGFRPPNH